MRRFIRWLCRRSIATSGRSEDALRQLEEANQLMRRYRQTRTEPTGNFAADMVTGRYRPRRKHEAKR